MNKKGELSGALQIGLRPVYLKSFMGLAGPVFKREDDGLRWAQIKVSGTSKKPKQDLSTQLLAQLHKHPLALFGLSGKITEIGTSVISSARKTIGRGRTDPSDKLGMTRCDLPGG